MPPIVKRTQYHILLVVNKFSGKDGEFHLWQCREFPITQSILQQPWKGASVPFFPHRGAMVIAGKSDLPCYRTCHGSCRIPL